MGRLFGTDGARGIANKELTIELAMKIGKAAAEVLAVESNKPKILFGSGDLQSCGTGCLGHGEYVLQRIHLQNVQRQRGGNFLYGVCFRNCSNRDHLAGRCVFR